MPPADLPTPPPLPPEQLSALPQNKKAWQFSLRTLLLGTTAFALLCGLASALPVSFSQAILGLAWIAAAGWLLTGLFFAQGNTRAFCLGAAIVVSSAWTGIGGRFLQGSFGIITMLLGGINLNRSITLWLNHGILALTALANGWFCIRARQYFERQSNDAQDR